MVSWIYDIYVFASKGKLYKYDTATLQYEEKMSLGKAVGGGCLVSVSDALFLVGGLQEVCSKYDVKSNSWSDLTPPIHNHELGAALALNDKIYLMGGSINCSDLIEEYDIKTDKWKTLDFKLPVGLMNFTAAVVDYL